MRTGTCMFRENQEVVVTVLARTLLIAGASVLLGFQAQAQGLSYSLDRKDPQVNIALSEQYDRLLETSRHFRAFRIVKECRPINLHPLHNDCVGSFDQYEPFRGAY